MYINIQWLYECPGHWVVFATPPCPQHLPASVYVLVCLWDVRTWRGCGAGFVRAEERFQGSLGGCPWPRAWAFVLLGHPGFPHFLLGAQLPARTASHGAWEPPLVEGIGLSITGSPSSGVWGVRKEDCECGDGNSRNRAISLNEWMREWRTEWRSCRDPFSIHVAFIGSMVRFHLAGQLCLDTKWQTRCLCNICCGPRNLA